MPQTEQGATQLAHVPTPSTLVGNPYLAPLDGRCLINDLPTELLAQIFVLGANTDGPIDDDEDIDEDSLDGENDEDEDTDEDEEDEAEDEQPPFEVTVSHVCKLWRDVSINKPTLWSTLDFSEGLPYTKSAIYLERSKGAPLGYTVR